MEKTPLLSIICLSWNQEKYIEQALTSVINQTYKNFEIIYLDNDSSDSSFEIGKKLLENSNTNFQTKQFDTNIGAVKAVNYAIKNLCNGSYISMIAMDDWLDLTNYELKINYLLEHPEYAIVYSNGYHYFDDTKEIKLLPDNNLKEGYIFNDLLKLMFLYMMGTVIKKEVYDKVGLYSEDNSIEDWDFALRASQHYQVGLIRQPLFYYRQHSSNYSKGSNRYFMDCLKVINKYKKYENYTVGYNWINTSYIAFIYQSPFNLKSLFYLIKNSKKNKKNAKNILRYILSFAKNE